jgi:Ca-activated chloride channel family protein
MRAFSPHPSHRSQLIQPVALLCVSVLVLCFSTSALAQHQLPYLDGARNSPFAQLDFEELYHRQIIHHGAQQDTAGQEQLAGGTVSALDMTAPEKAVRKLKEATSLLRAQRAKEAIRYLQNAIEIYPRFVSAHIALGLAYFDLKDKRAKDEFETATRLDDQFPISFLCLGMMSLWTSDFAAADASLAKAAFLNPNDPQVLSVLAFAQNGARKYSDVLRTVSHLHQLDHRGMGDVHYISAAAALSLNDINTSKIELRTLLSEDPSGPLSAVARQELDGLTRGLDPRAQTAATESMPAVPITTTVATFPNSLHLQSELHTVATTSDSDLSPDLPPPASDSSSDPAPPTAAWTDLFTIRQAVDETALFLAVSEHGQMINNLSLSHIQIRDGNKPPERILQFLPQSQLPLRLGVLVDTSSSVDHRIGFEKNAAKTFLKKVLNPESDLAFVAGFDTAVSVTQDFTSDAAALDHGVDNLGQHGEGTAVFDAIHFACWKLAAYPDQGRVARVLVVLTDGQDNASHRSLKQSIEAAEASGITVYTFNTSDSRELQTDANSILQVIAQRSGGESVCPRTLQDLEHYFQQLSEAIRSRYLIAYKPADFRPDGSYRKLKVTAERDGKHLHVHVRKGYYARVAWNQ